MAKKIQNRGDEKSPLSKAAHAPVTQADVEYLKQYFPAEEVDAALDDGDLVLVRTDCVNNRPPPVKTIKSVKKCADGEFPIPAATARQPPTDLHQRNVDWYIAKYPGDAQANIERWRAEGKIKIVDEQPPLYRTRADLERVAAREIPGVTPDLLEAMVHDGQIVLIDKPPLKKMKSPIPEAAATYPLTRQNIANIKRDFPMYAEELDKMIADGEVVVIEEWKEASHESINICKRCNRTIPVDANYCPYCAEPVETVQTRRRRSPLPATSPPAEVTQGSIEMFLSMNPDLGAWLAEKIKKREIIGKNGEKISVPNIEKRVQHPTKPPIKPRPKKHPIPSSTLRL